ncbi:MAG: hypothetical protein PWP31_9 [Clostridia bacterium]|nr:hypothetical protein [Clostridia bacterium]
MEISTQELRKNIWKLAWPATLRMAFQTSMMIITLILVGNYFLGAEAVAAIGLAQRVMFLVIGTMTALGVGTTALIAHYYGAGKTEKAGAIVSQSLIIGIAVAVILALLLDKFGGHAIALLMLGNPEPQVIAMGSNYLRVIGFSMILGIVMMIINSALQGAGDMKTPMFFTIAANILTMVLGVILIPGLGPIPALGLTGAGLAEGLARALGGVVALLFLLRGKFVVKIKTRDFLQWHSQVVKKILEIGLPAAGEQLVRQSSQILYTILIANLGTVAIAANQIVMTVLTTSFLPGFGFGLAATTLVGQALGAQNPDDAERYGYETNKFAMAFMGMMGIIFFIFARSIAAIFVPEKEVIELAASCLRLVAFAQVPFSVIMVLSGGLRGAGDTRWVMYLTGAGQWGIRLLLSFVLIWWFGFGLVGAWIAMLIDVLVRSILVLWRYRSGRWKDVFEIEDNKPRVRFSES